MIDLDELRKLAEAATPGPWEWEEPSDDPWPEGDESLVTTWNAEDGEPNTVVTSWGYDADGVTASAEDRAFIAAAYPQVVLELIERVRQAEAELRDAFKTDIPSLRAERDAALADKVFWHKVTNMVKSQRDAAQARIAEVKAERDAALARIAELEQGLRSESLARGVDTTLLREYERRFAEAAKLHYRDTPSVGGDWCPEDHHKWPCDTAVALGLNEGENE